jgi:hypothetical protein
MAMTTTDAVFGRSKQEQIAVFTGCHGNIIQEGALPT